MTDVTTNAGDHGGEIAELRKRIEHLERSEKKARDRSDYLQGILDCLPAIVTSWGLDGILNYANQTFLNESGFRLDDVIGRNFLDLYPPQEMEGISQVYDNLLQQPDGSFFKKSFNGITKDGEWVVAEGTVIKKTSAPIHGFVGCSVNVTEKAMVEIDYRESVEALVTIFNNVQDALLIHDKSGTFIQVNQRLIEMLGVDRLIWVKDSSSINAYDYYSPEDNSFDLRDVWDDVLKGDVKQLEYRIRRQTDGTVFDVEVFMRSIRLKGQDHILATVKDITEKKRVMDELQRALGLAQQLRIRAEEASQTKSKFLANMSHELRTPLNAILGFSELLEGRYYGEINDKQSSYLRAIYTSGEHLLQLINDILDIAKVEAGKMEMFPSSIDLSQLLQNSISMIKETAYKRGLKLEHQMAGVLCEQNIWADEVRLKQIVMNLLSNAVKFTPSGGTVTLEAVILDQEIRLRVMDTGIGIKPEDQARIFEEFEQVDSSFSRQQQGTGLGLSLTRKLVELHGGRIWLESEGENKGSIFTVEIPYVKAGQKLVQDFPGRGMLGTLTPFADMEVRDNVDDRPLVLVVEDNSANMKLTTTLLDIGGYKAIPAFTSEEAFNILKQHHPALILMDISLPGMDGLTATQRIKNDPSTADIPVVALTAHAMKDDETRALEAGCDAYLLKPVDTRQFYRTLSEIVHKSPFLPAESGIEQHHRLQMD